MFFQWDNFTNKLGVKKGLWWAICLDNILENSNRDPPRYLAIMVFLNTPTEKISPISQQFCDATMKYNQGVRKALTILKKYWLPFVPYWNQHKSTKQINIEVLELTYLLTYLFSYLTCGNAQLHPGKIPATNNCHH